MVWEIKPWESVLEIRSGRNQKEVLDPNGKYPILGSAGKIMGYASNYLCDEGTTIIGRKGTIDNPLYIDTKFWNVDTAFGLIGGDLLNKKYLYYFCRSFNFKSLDKGTTLPSLVKKDLLKILIPTPPINEQKRIVAILDQAFAEIEKARANAEQNLKNARELFESYLNSRLLDVCSNKPEQTLSCITEIIVDCEHKTAPTQGEGFPSIRTPNIGKGKLLLNGVRRVSEETYKLWTKRAVPTYGDLILAREAPAGNVGVIPKEETVCLGQRTVLIRPKAETVNSKYLAFLLLHPIMQERLLSHSTGATVQHVNMKDIRKLPISKLPSVNEQINDVSVLEDTQSKAVHLEGIYSRKLEALDELKKSILQKAFTGELTKETTT
jgi:type I restriction enzyme S subunit